MSRSKWKFKYLTRANDFSKKDVWDRDQTITKKYLNKTLKIYNGKQYIKVLITKQKLGYKMGEFSYTRKHTKIEPKNKKGKKK